MTTDQHPLARFVDRLTMVYDRTYPHPIERVWDAVSTAAHLDAWMLPECTVERRLGGVCGFGWGGPADALPPATITVWEPPRAVQYTHGDGSFMRFDLAALADEVTSLAFTLHFLAAGDLAPVEGDPGGDLPGGPGTAWRPGFLVGYHHQLDRLDSFLRGTWTLADNRRDLARFVAEGWDAEDLALIERYRTHVVDTIPAP